MPDFKNGIFVSYSHKDKEWLDLLMVHLKPLVRTEKVRIWNDTDIKPGSKWRDEITENIEKSRIALLLVSPNFLASDFIMETEFPEILKHATNGKTIIYWVAVSFSLYKTTQLKDIQCVNTSSKPLESLSKSDLNLELVEISKKIANAIEVNVVSNFLQVIDEFVPQQKAFIEDTIVTEEDDDYSTKANQIGDEINFIRAGNIVENIQAADFEKLDESSKQLIRSYETTMKDLFERWTELQPKSFSRDEVIKEAARKEMGELRSDICIQLNAILDYLDFMGKNLNDHYHHVRYMCTQSERQD